MAQLQQLFSNQIDQIIVDDFLTSQEIASFLGVLARQPEWAHSLNDKSESKFAPGMPTQPHLFVSQYMAMASPMSEAEYLQLCQTHQRAWSQLCAECGFDLFERVVTYLNPFLDRDIQVPGIGSLRYSPVVVRDLSSGVLAHADFAPYDGPDWQIKTVMEQIAWNVYLTDPGEGGETIIYEHQWSDEDTLDDHSYGIETFNKPEKSRFSVCSGRLALFNSLNFHSVNQSTCPRIAVGGLLGLTSSGDIFAWA